ncbi:MAG: hypothetical protein KKD28_01395 [Chloroflexi bacterium]|nr:hypothetical protein [Chloroflexota bacterium]
MPLSPTYLTPDQRDIIESPLDAKTFLEGPAGAGKTTVGVERAMHLLENGVPGESLLILVPQRTLATPYYDVLHSPGAAAGGAVTVLTIGGLAQRSVDLFWPIIAAEAGFAHPDQPPAFLTLESAQYYMARLVRPLLDEGCFDSVTIDRNRLYSQILDNLNKAAAIDFPHTQIGERLQSAWIGDPGQSRVYADAQRCAELFRQYCLDHNLLDFSLQLEIFWHHLWPAPLCRATLQDTYRHLIVDNLEEDVPITHDLLREWLPYFDSALLIFDHDAGYRRFLGADPATTATLRDLCENRVQVEGGFVSAEGISALGESLASALARRVDGTPPPATPPALRYPQVPTRYYPEMLDWVTGQIAALVDEGTPPGEIVVLAPYLSDALRFSLVDRLNRLGIPSRSHRPSRSLREEPAAQCLLTLAALAHPQWEIRPSKFDVAYALIQAIADLDLVRAQLLTGIVYRKGQLSSFERIKPEIQERITYVLGGRYEALRQWLADYTQAQPAELDHFLSRLFGEALSQPGFGFHFDYNAAEIAANLVESVRKFRWAVGASLAAEGIPLGKEYLEMVSDGVIAAQYLHRWQSEPEDAVFLAPAYTFLMSNRPVDIQFWLDVGTRGWYERIFQPLTHPYVLSRQWNAGQPWTDAQEYETSLDSLRRLTLGLTRRCREQIFIGINELGEQGYEQKGALLQAINRVLRQG